MRSTTYPDAMIETATLAANTGERHATVLEGLLGGIYEPGIGGSIKGLLVKVLWEACEEFQRDQSCSWRERSTPSS